MHNIAKTFFPILLLLFAAVVTAQNGRTMSEMRNASGLILKLVIRATTSGK